MNENGIENVIQPALLPIEETKTETKSKVKAKRKPGRKPKRPRATLQTPQQKAETPLMTSVQRRDAAHANQARPERVAMAANYEKLGAVARPYIRDGFHLRFFRDAPGRLEQALTAYYVFVTDDNGNNVTYQKGLRKMHLMEIPNDLWEAEKALMQAKIDARIQKDAEIGSDQYVPIGKAGPLNVDHTDYNDD